MSRVIEFSDGAERGDTSWWTSASAIVSASSNGVLHGVYCYNMGSSESAYKTLNTPLSEFYFRYYAKSTAGPAVYFRKGATALLAVTQNPTYARLDITGAATGNTGNNSIVLGNWYCLEVHYKISDTVGEVTVRIDGVQVFTFSGDTKPGSDSTIDNILMQNSGSGSPAFYADDFALDTSDWCGLGYYVGLTADGAGDSTQWTPTGGANYANVEIPANDSTYNSGTTGQTDNYAMTTTTIGTGTVLRVIPYARANNPAGGTLNIGLKTNGTDYTTTVTTPTSFTWLSGAEYINNPQSGNSWTQGEIDSLQMTVSMP